MAPVGTDLSTLTFGVTGANPPAFPLLNGTALVSGLPTLAPDNFILNIPPADFGLAGALGLTPGDYYIGVACSLGGAMDTYWTEEITLIADTVNGGSQNLRYQQGDPAVAPTVLPEGSGGSTVDETSITVDLTPGGSVPPDTSYEVTVTDGVNTFTQTSATLPITVTGLTTGVTYDVTATATNAVGTSPASAIVQFTPQRPAIPWGPMTVSTGGAGELIANWPAPAGGTPVNYTVTAVEQVSGTPVTGSPFTVPAGTLSQSVTGLTPGVVIDFTVAVTYADSLDRSVDLAASAAAAAAQVLNQEITVERPAGALILTQRCGVNNDLAAFTAVDAFPGYPFDLAAEAASADQVGTSPDIDLVTPGVQDDPEFGNYPFPNPATYPTQCGLDLGVASFVTSGTLAGQFYAADGRLDEVTVVDTRDTDIGWTVQGTMSTFAAGSNTFAGNYLGWTPVVTDDSDAAVTGGYDQVVTAGAEVLPGTGVNANTGLGDGQPLATALAGEGLGIATLDARLTLLIPTSVPAGSYSGILALTVI